MMLNTALLQPAGASNPTQGGNWLCCLCFRRSCADSLSDLFGPYPVSLSSQPPEELCPPHRVEEGHGSGAVRKGQKSAKESSSYSSDSPPFDLWFHGQCALWAPELF